MKEDGPKNRLRAREILVTPTAIYCIWGVVTDYLRIGAIPPLSRHGVAW